MISFVKRTKVNNIEIMNSKNQEVEASLNDDCTITLKGKYMFMDGEEQIIVLDRNETKAIIKLFKYLNMEELDYL